MLQNGLTEAACYRYYKPTTPSLILEDFGIDTKEYMNIDMSHVPNYNRRRKSPFRGKMRASQTSKVDVTDTTDESSSGGGTLPSSSPPPPQDNVNTNSNGGHHNGVMTFDLKEGKDTESDLLTSAAQVAVTRRSFQKEDTIPEVEEEGQGSLNNNKRTDGEYLLQTVHRKLSRKNGSKYSRKSDRKSYPQKSSQLKETLNEMEKDEEAFIDYDNISAHSRESIDINSRINAYFDTLAKKHDETASSSCSTSLNSFDVSSSHDDLATSSMLSDTATSSRLSGWSTVSSDVSVTSRSLDTTAPLDTTEDSSDKFPTVKVLEDELLEMIDHELYGPYFDNKRFSQLTLSQFEDKTSKPSRDSLDSTRTMSDVAECDTPVRSARNSTASEYSEARGSMTDDFVVLPNTPAPTELETDNFGFPLALFGKVRRKNM